jgi:peroxiredoxin
MRFRKLALGLGTLVLLGAVAASAAALGTGSRAPEIGLKDLEGRHIRMSALRGKVVIVDFWASWCDPCREEMPVLNRLYKKYKGDGLVVIGVSVDRDKGNVRKFLEQTPVSFPIVHDPDHQVAGRYEPPRMPSSYVIGKRGVVRHVHKGYSAGDGKKFEKEVRALLGK